MWTEVTGHAQHKVNAQFYFTAAVFKKKKKDYKGGGNSRPDFEQLQSLSNYSSSPGGRRIGVSLQFLEESNNNAWTIQMSVSD